MTEKSESMDGIETLLRAAMYIEQQEFKKRVAQVENSGDDDATTTTTTTTTAAAAAAAAAGTGTGTGTGTADDNAGNLYKSLDSVTTAVFRQRTNSSKEFSKEKEYNQHQHQQYEDLSRRYHSTDFLENNFDENMDSSSSTDENVKSKRNYTLSPTSSDSSSESSRTRYSHALHIIPSYVIATRSKAAGGLSSAEGGTRYGSSAPVSYDFRHHMDNVVTANSLSSPPLLDSLSSSSLSSIGGHSAGNLNVTNLSRATTSGKQIQSPQYYYQTHQRPRTAFDSADSGEQMLVDDTQTMAASFPSTSSRGMSEGQFYMHFASASTSNTISGTDVGVSANNRRRTTSTNSTGAGTREVHNLLEKNRRAHLKVCYEELKSELEITDEDRKKTSNLAILAEALRKVTILQKEEEDINANNERLDNIIGALERRIKSQLFQANDSNRLNGSNDFKNDESEIDANDVTEDAPQLNGNDDARTATESVTLKIALSKVLSPVIIKSTNISAVNSKTNGNIFTTLKFVPGTGKRTAIINGRQIPTSIVTKTAAITHGSGIANAFGNSSAAMPIPSSRQNISALSTLATTTVVLGRESSLSPSSFISSSIASSPTSSPTSSSLSSFSLSPLSSTSTVFSSGISSAASSMISLSPPVSGSNGLTAADVLKIQKKAFTNVVKGSSSNSNNSNSCNSGNSNSNSSGSSSARLIGHQTAAAFIATAVPSISAAKNINTIASINGKGRLVQENVEAI